MNPRKGNVLQTKMDDQSNKLVVDRRRYCQLSRPTTVRFVTLSVTSVHRILVRGVNPPLAARGEENFITPPNPPIQKTALFACFHFLIFHPFLQGGQLTPFAPMRGHPC